MQRDSFNFGKNLFIGLFLITTLLATSLSHNPIKGISLCCDDTKYRYDNKTSECVCN